MIASVRAGAFAALAATLVVGMSAPTPASAMRHVNYRLAIGHDGAPSSGMVRLDFVASHGEGAVTVDIADDDAIPVRARIDRSGHIETILHENLSDPDLALLNSVALEMENLNGVEVGDRWSRFTRVPGGRATTQYQVNRNDDRGHIGMAVSRTVEFADGEISSWRGNVEYDANAFVPTAISFSGRIHNADDPAARPHAVTVSMKLVSDSFAHRSDD
jgi:hypothetical protein